MDSIRWSKNKGVCIILQGIITNCYMGARDLYYGVPDLEGAVVEKVDRCPEGEAYEKDYPTTLTLKRKDGKEFVIIVKQAR